MSELWLTVEASPAKRVRGLVSNRQSEMPLQCPNIVCDRVFEYQQELLRHLDAPKSVCLGNKVPIRYQCCGNCLTTVMDVRNHLTLEHPTVKKLRLQQPIQDHGELPVGTDHEETAMNCTALHISSVTSRNRLTESFHESNNDDYVGHHDKECDIASYLSSSPGYGEDCAEEMNEESAILMQEGDEVDDDGDMEEEEEEEQEATLNSSNSQGYAINETEVSSDDDWGCAPPKGDVVNDDDYDVEANEPKSEFTSKLLRISKHEWLEALQRRPEMPGYIKLLTYCIEHRISRKGYHRLIELPQFDRETLQRAGLVHLIPPPHKETLERKVEAFLKPWTVHNDSSFTASNGNLHNYAYVTIKDALGIWVSMIYLKAR